MESQNMNEGRELVARGSIDMSRLNRNNYVISLMNEGQRAGLLIGEDLIRIQNDFMHILQELIQRYTQWESTSVATETAESIMSSIIYATDSYLFSFEQPEKAILTLKTNEVRKIYEKGVETVHQCFEETKKLYKEISRNKLEVPVDAYNTTIDESLPVFLRKYEIIFEAHNTLASIDYPLAIDDMKLQGVFYIKQYMERLKLETTFCSMFDRQAILGVLSHYGRVCRFDYRIELFNIFELLLNQAVFSILAGGEANHIRISEGQYQRLAQRFISLTKSGIRSAVFHAVERIQKDLGIGLQLKAYIDGCKENLVQRVTNAARHNSLRSIIVTDREATVKTIVISFNEEDTMSDVQLRLLLNKIMICERKEEKVGIIVEHFNSFRDYLDLLESGCLYGEEYGALFQEFGDMEVAVLAKVVFYEELRTKVNLPNILELKNNYSMEWQRQFVDFLRGREKNWLCDIDELLQEIDYEQMNFR